MLSPGNNMQKYVQTILTALALAGLLLGTGCKGISASHTCEIIGDRLPPSDPAKVEVLKDGPARRFARLGEIRVISDTEEETSKIQNALRKEAAKLGADAVVVLKQGVHSDEKGETKGVVIGVAIKYL